MKNQYKLAAAALIGLTLASCADDGLYEVNTPDWLAQRVDSIAAEKNKNQGDAPVLEGMMEDYYTIGKTDFTSGWWADFSKDYVIPDGEVWNAVFTLNINPNASNTYKNFALIVTNDVHRGDGGYTEYGACRFDHQPSGNSEWGDVFFQQHRDDVTSTLTFGSDTDEGVDKLGGKVILTIDRSNPEGFKINITNGVVTKTMDIKEPLPNLNEDGANTNIRAFLVVEGSYIQFEETNIIPVGGLTSKEDKQPIGMTLKGVPGKVMVGTPIADALAGVSAVVEFEQAVTKEVSIDELSFQVIPDVETLGVKTIVAAYGLTFKGEGAFKPVIATAQFSVVDKMYYTLGESNCGSGWWSAHSDYVKVNPGETQVASFTNYTNGAGNWNNFVFVLTKADAYEYAVLRADNYGWRGGDNSAANNDVLGWELSGGQSDWGAWLAAMNGAKVTTYVTNYGNGYADVKAVMLGTDGVEYLQEYKNVGIDDPNDFYYHFTVDGCCLVFDDVLGAEDNSTGWWGAHSQNIQVPAGLSVTRTFINHTPATNNWNNFVVVLCAADNTEYAVVRADNYGWRGGDNSAANNDVLGWQLSGGQADWGSWLAAMDGAKVSVTVTNRGDGFADVKCIMHGTDGVDYLQDYLNISVDNIDDVYFRFTVDGCHLVFSEVE